jgi:hypothetical protein
MSKNFRDPVSRLPFRSNPNPLPDAIWCSAPTLIALVKKLEEFKVLQPETTPTAFEKNTIMGVEVQTKIHIPFGLLLMTRNGQIIHTVDISQKEKNDNEVKTTA